MKEEDKIKPNAHTRPVWPYKTKESLDKGLEVIASKKSKVVAVEQAIARLLKTDKDLLQQALPEILEIFKQSTLNTRHAWLGHFEAFCSLGVDFTEHLTVFSRYLKDKNYHFRETIGSFLMRRGRCIKVCYKDVNWCLVQKNEDIQKLGLRLAQVIGDDVDKTTLKFIQSLANGTAETDEIAEQAKALLGSEGKPSVSPVEGTAIQATPLAHNIVCHALAHKRILMITQHKAMRILLAKILRHFEAIVHVVDNASDGLRAIRHGREAGEIWAIVIIDMIDPIETLRYLKKEKGREDQKVLVLSKALDSDSIKRLVQYNIDGLLLKPFGIADFTDALTGMIEE